MKQAGRLLSLDVEQLTKNDIGLLMAEDFEASADNRKQTKRGIGFNIS